MNTESENLQVYAIIRRIEKALEDSPRSRLGNGKRMVDIELIVDLLGDLKVSIPDDIRRATNILNEADSVLESADERARMLVESAERRAALTIDKANSKAERVLKDSYQEFESRVNDHSIYLEAQKRGQLIVRRADANARGILDDARQTADTMLKQVRARLMDYCADIDIERERFAPAQAPNASKPVPAREPEAEPAPAPDAIVQDGNPEPPAARGASPGFFARMLDKLIPVRDDEEEDYADAADGDS